MEDKRLETQEVNLRIVWQMIRKRRWTIVITLAIVVIVAMIVTFAQRPVYEAQAEILIRGYDRGWQTDPITSSVPNPGSSTDDREAATQVALIQSTPLIEEASRNTGGSEIPITVEGGKDSNIITITGLSTDREEAMRFVNNLADVYVSHNLSQNRRSARAGRQFLEDQQRRYEMDLEEASRALRDYEAKTGTMSLDTAAESHVKALADLGGSRTTAETDRDGAMARSQQIRSLLDRTAPTVVSSESITRNPSVQRYQDQIADLNMQRVALLRLYQPDSRKVRSLDTQIASAEEKQRGLVRDIVAGREVIANPVRQSLMTSLADAEGQALVASAKVAGLSRAIQREESALRLLPAEQYRLARLQRAVQVAEKMYLTLQERYQGFRVAEESTVANAEVVQPASLPEKPVRPNKQANLLAAVLIGLVLGVGFAAVQEAMDDSLRTADDIERALGIPLLGLVGDIREPRERLIHTAGISSRVLEAFRMIRASIKHAAVGGEMPVLMVTSAGRGEGKTMVASNLALSMARTGRRVILVDGDLRQPSLHKAFGLANDHGLVGLLTGAEALDAAEREVAPNLRVITAGPAPTDPAELLESPQFGRLVQQLRAGAEVVIFDSAPLLGAADASIMAGSVSAVVYVTAAGEVEQRAARRALQMLQQARAHVIGVILNKADPRFGGRHERYYYSYCIPSGAASGNGGWWSRRPREEEEVSSRVEGK